MNLDVIVLLTGAVIAVPIFKMLGLGSVLGYLAAGAIIGPWALGLINDVDDILHFSELGVVMLLFIIGLELKPSRLWALRRSIFGFGSGSSGGFHGQNVATATGAVVGVVFIGGWVLRNLLKIVARSRVREVLTATALLTVLGTATLLEQAGLSMALGAFLAGVLLADTEFRHQLEADIEPFKGLLLGLFFIAVGMSMNLGLIAEQPLNIFGLVITLVAIKFLVLFALGKWQGLENASARKLGWVLSQGGEFAFVIFGVAVATSVLPNDTAELWIVVVSLSMLTTPLLVFLEDRLLGSTARTEPYDIPSNDEPKESRLPHWMQATNRSIL